MRCSPFTLSRRSAVGSGSPFPIVAAGIVSLLALFSLRLVSPTGALRYSEEMLDAAVIMQGATETTRAFCDSTGIEIDETIDPNRTCLIGPEYSELMTTLGHLDAKRTTADPAMASIIVHMLDRIGVAPGDTIAVGSSASFPALLIATLAAAQAMDLHAVALISLGASSYGATNPQFNLLDIYTLLLREGVVATPPAGVSLGGRGDVGGGFDPHLREQLLGRIAASGIQFIYEPDLRRNVALRMAEYGATPPKNPVTAFINAGGSHANLGPSPLALDLDPGLNVEVALPPVQQRGVLHEMAARDVPVIHLLFIRGLTLEYGITWDPIPLKEPGEMPLHYSGSDGHFSVWLIGIPFLLAVGVLVTRYSRSAARRSPRAPGESI